MFEKRPVTIYFGYYVVYYALHIRRWLANLKIKQHLEKCVLVFKLLIFDIHNRHIPHRKPNKKGSGIK